MDWDFWSFGPQGFGPADKENRLPNIPIPPGSPVVRFLARTIDFWIYGTLVICFQLLVMNQNTIEISYRMFVLGHRLSISHYRPGVNIHVSSWSNLMLIFWITLILEPIFLRLFGTTPGKALLGIKVLDKTGNKPSLKDGLLRTAIVIVLGYGLFIPVVNVYRLYKSFIKCRDANETPWDDECNW